MNWDLELLSLFNRTLGHPILDALMAAVSTLAIPLLAFVPLPLLLARRWRAALALLVILVLSLLLAVGIQFALGRPRPVNIRPVLSPPLFPSFPSGHAAAAFGFATFAILARRRWSFPAFAGATLISISRLTLGLHYPTDLVGGAILGAAVAAVVYGCFYRPERGLRPRWAWLLWGQVALVLLATLTAWLNLLDLRLLAFRGADKALHFLLFGTLAFFAVGWWARQAAGVVGAPLALLILIDEALQLWGTSRSFDLLDLAASLAGLIVGVGVGVLARGSFSHSSDGAGRPPGQRAAGKGKL